MKLAFKIKKHGTTTRKKLTQQPDFQQGNFVMALCDDSNGSEFSEIEERQIIHEPSLADINIDYHLRVTFSTKRTIAYYMGRIFSIDVEKNEVETTFTRRHKTAKYESLKFFFSRCRGHEHT